MDWFGGSYKDFDFEMFSNSHWMIIAILLLGSTAIFVNREKFFDNNKWRKAEIGAAVSLILIELTYHFWMYINGDWDVSHAIPLELCSISLILTVLLLLTRKKIIYEILLFTALLGASQAIFTPALNFDFPHFRFFHFFYTHLMDIWVVLYFTWARGYRPTIWSVVKLFVFLNVLMPIIMWINKLVGGNYMYLSHKPKTASLLDVLGPYPYYILSLEALLISLSLIVWLIFREKGNGNTKRIKELPIR
ncbi:MULTISPECIES: YwaF family protein [Neobacillus]|uniref:TIGR02206 family membrane protein n=1 Tax=Neobacillus rhizophilus TaxID=2833579 RepID=A0A942YVP2_9BACI|nr:MULTISPECIES: TIGR02206 family membrane protein [Neobacillus]MBS4211756.1 TIGR02206 family membrane protein [Neobacillus rhizophilus]MBU8919506.1 TIGR02206 family membrane protein [Bacillus sp. FJAT-29953]